MEVQSLSQCSISSLPTEIIEEILKLLDGESSVICKRICKKWRDHVHYLEKNLVNFWFEHCQNEVPDWVQFDILDNVYPSHWKNQTFVDWQIIYKCWNFWKYNYETYTDCELLSDNLGLIGITSIKHSGRWLLISTYHRQGKLIAWNLETSSFFTVYEILGGIINFELVNTNGQVPPNSSRRMTSKESSAKLNEFYETIEHDEIWVEVEFSYIRLGRDFVYKIDRLAQKIRHSYGHEMRLVRENGNAVLYNNKTCETVSGPQTTQYDLPLNYCDIFHFQMNKVSLLVDCSTTTIDIVRVNHGALLNTVPDTGAYPNIDRSQLYTWRNSLFVSFSEKRQVAFKKEGSKIGQTTPLRKGVITAALFYAGYLFLGNDRGQLMAYKVSQPDDCLDLIVYESDCWTIYLNPNKLIKIIHITVVESKKPGMKPVIVCASSEEVYRISFPENQVKQKHSKCAIKEVRW